MLDCGRVNALRLQFPDRQPADLELDGGVHAIGRDAAGRLAPVARTDALVFISIDERGIWLQAREGARGLHVNGRRVRRMAMLRPGDSIYLDGGEMLLAGREPAPAPAYDPPPGEGDGRLVLRGIGGRHHGRCITLDAPRALGSARENDIRIEDAASRRLLLQPHDGGIVMRDEGEGVMVNGHIVRSALLLAGDQLVLDGRNRFLLEAPAMSRRGRDTDMPDQAPARPTPASGPTPKSLPSSMRRAPWLLLAALLISAALSLLLMYGAR